MFDFELVERKENPGDIPIGIIGKYSFSVTKNNSNLPLPFFGGNYPIFPYDNIY